MHKKPKHHIILSLMLPFLLITAVTFLILDYTKGNNVTGFVTFVPDNSVEKEVYNNVINLNEGEYFDFGVLNFILCYQNLFSSL